MKIELTRTTDCTYPLTIWNRIAREDGTTAVRQIMWGPWILHFIFENTEDAHAEGVDAS